MYLKNGFYFSEIILKQCNNILFLTWNYKRILIKILHEKIWYFNNTQNSKKILIFLLHFYKLFPITSNFYKIFSIASGFDISYK